MEILILIGVVVGTLLLGLYAFKEGRKIEERKQFKKNFDNFKKQIWDIQL